jgi:hypothetical protein
MDAYISTRALRALHAEQRMSGACARRLCIGCWRVVGCFGRRRSRVAQSCMQQSITTSPSREPDPYEEAQSSRERTDARPGGGDGEEIDLKRARTGWSNGEAEEAADRLHETRNGKARRLFGSVERSAPSCQSNRGLRELKHGRTTHGDDKRADPNAQMR